MITQRATLGSLLCAGAVSAPATMFLLTLLLVIPREDPIAAKIALPLLGAGIVFLFGWIVSGPLALVIGGVVHWFLRSVGFKGRLPYLFAGPVVGLLCAMVVHLSVPDLIGDLLAGGWPTFAYLTSWCIGGTILTAVFWTIRRPDRPWDDLEEGPQHKLEASDSCEPVLDYTNRPKKTPI
jgi:hypothetical protein